MSKGLVCRVCKGGMTVEKEDSQPKGTYVTYVCDNPRCATVENGFPQRDKIFEEPGR